MSEALTPDPLTPMECDLRDFSFMPLDVVRLRDSDIASIDAESFRAAVLSWCVSWHQSPAASLPDDDAALCRLLGYGRDIKGWLKIREGGALRGYIKCSDGRLYHPVVAEKANEAWQKKIAQRNRTEAARMARLSQGQSQSLSQTRPPSVTDNVTETTTEIVTESKGQGQGEERTEEEKERTLRVPKKATRLPDDWTPDPAGRAFSDHLGLDGPKILEVFRDYWRSAPGPKGLKSDWEATWKNWCRKEAGDPRSRFRSQSNDSQPQMSGFV